MHSVQEHAILLARVSASGLVGLILGHTQPEFLLTCLQALP